MRPTALVPLMFSLTAFILSMLCIFAGSKKGYLESANLLTVSLCAICASSELLANVFLAQYLYARPNDTEYVEDILVDPQFNRERRP